MHGARGKPGAAPRRKPTWRGERMACASLERRPRVLMLCPHEPNLDPRIRWEAEGAADRFDVVVLGFNLDDGSLPPHERLAGYEVWRVRGEPGGAGFFYRSIARIMLHGGIRPLCLLAVMVVPMTM